MPPEAGRHQRSALRVFLRARQHLRGRWLKRQPLSWQRYRLVTGSQRFDEIRLRPRNLYCSCLEGNSTRLFTSTVQRRTCARRVLLPGKTTAPVHP